LFQNESPQFFKGKTKANGATFLAFGKAIGLSDEVAQEELHLFIAKIPLIETLIQHSFLSDKTKKTFHAHYSERRNRLADFRL
jgi:hypothetical protein